MDVATVGPGPSRREAEGSLWQQPIGWAPVAIGLTGFDALATAMWVSLGIAMEANPWLAWMIDEAGVAAAMVVRAVIGIGLVLTLDGLRPRSDTARRALPAVTAILGAVALWHLVGPVLAS